MKNVPLWLIVLLAVLFLGGGSYAVYSMTRGLRNNNPGNIRHGSNWDGMAATQNDDEFITFISPEYGIRAMAKLLSNYQTIYGLKTLSQIIAKWAPPTENNTAAYTADVKQELGIDPRTDPAVTLHANNLRLLVPAMIRHENGVQPYDAATIARGVAMIA